MVSTRNHPRAFPSPTASPTKPSRTSPTPDADTHTTATPNGTTTSKQLSRVRPSTRSSTSSPGTWTHTPSNLTLFWLAVSLPLVVWDTGYVFLRPHSMPGGKLHWFWSPYAAYGEIDRLYGFHAWNQGNGFTAAQGTMNVVETLGYFLYLWLVWSAGTELGKQGRGAPSKEKVGWWGAGLTVQGRTAGVVCLLGFAVTTMTWAKTVLYWMVEGYAGWHVFTDNKLSDAILLWVITNGPWIIVPMYLAYVFGAEILEGLEIAAEGSKKT